RKLGKERAAGAKVVDWLSRAISSFAEMPSKRKGTAIPAHRIVAVLQGWDVGAKEVEAQIAQCSRAGAGGYVVAFCKIEQGWEPRLYKIKHVGPSKENP